MEETKFIKSEREIELEKDLEIAREIIRLLSDWHLPINDEEISPKSLH